MTTAHRATWNSAKAVSGGDIMQGNYRGAVSHSLSVYDLPGHTKMKFRQQGQAAPIELKERDLRKELEERERKHLETTNKKNFDFSEESGRKRKHQKLLKNSAEEKNDESSSDQEHKRTKRELDDFDDSDDTASSSSDSEDDSDSDDEEALLLELELQKIKKERAEQKQREAEEEAKREAAENLEGAVRGNPLLAPSGGGGLSRRWDDDVVFKNQARDEPKLKKRFVNDTIRNDFHRRFMQKYIK